MRGLAAAVVVAHHIPHYLHDRARGRSLDFEFGAIGVDIFFIISGFVMYNATISPSYGAAGFLVRRLARILPMYWLLTTILAVAIWTLPAAFSISVPVENWAKSLLFIPIYDERGYIRPVLSQGWTLHFEMLFYMLVAAAMLLVKSKPTQIAATVLAVVSTTIYALHVPLHGSAWQLVAPLSLEFSAGVFLAYIFHHHAPKIQNNLLAVFLAFILWCGAIYLGKFGRSADMGFDRALTWGISAFIFVFGALLLEKSINFKSIYARWFTLLGEASYSLYLVHGITFSITWKVSPSFVKDEPITAAIALFVVAICIAIPLHKIIELRLNEMTLKLGKKLTEA